MILLAMVIGLVVGFAAIILKYSVHGVQWLLTRSFVFEYQNLLYFAIPTVGILFVVLFVRHFIKIKIGEGIPAVLYAISKNNGQIKPHSMYSSISGSAVTVGFGGSVGLEAPIVSTGAAIGSNIGRMLHLNYRQILLLIGCGCAGAIAAIFKAPIAAIVFVMEVIMLDLKMSLLVPLLIASSTAALTSFGFLGMDVIYKFNITHTFTLNNIPFYIFFGIIAGFTSLHFTRMYMFINKQFEKIQKWYKKLLIGGIALGVIIYFFPPLYGEGYDSINSCLNGDFTHLFNGSVYSDYKNNIFFALILLFLIVVFKVIATSVTLGAGGIGGIFAPSLFTGAHAGLLFAVGMNYFGFELPISNFALVGMAGLLAGVFHAPLTAIFLIAEITHGYDLFMPIMIVATLSYATIKIFEKNSVYTMELARKGELLTHDADKNMLKLLKVDKLIETDFKTVDPDATLGDLVKIIGRSSRNIFPVLDEKGHLSGIVLLDHIRHIMFNPEMYNTTYVRDLMIVPTENVDLNDSMEDVAQKFQTSGNFNIPVLDNGKYVGFVSRANTFSAYRNLLKEFSDD